MAYSVVSQAELSRMGSGTSKAARKGYSVTSGKGDSYGAVKAREKQANAARKRLLSKTATKLKGGGGGKQRRVPKGSPRGGEFTR